jgi:hypothetical protein
MPNYQKGNHVMANFLQRLFGKEEAPVVESNSETFAPHTAKDLTPEQLRQLAREGTLTVDTEKEGKVTYIFI